MIEIQNLSKKFGRLQALKSINLFCNRGQSIALIGPNGCGKTTLIKAILGMVVPNKGNITFDGENILGKVNYRKQIGYMPQIGRYPDNMTVGQIISMMKEIRRSDSLPDEDLLNAFNLKTLFNKRMRTLSGGTTQKVSATLAFLFNPAVLILDEPTAGLDPIASEILKEKMMAEQKKGKLILITSHILSELDDLVSQIIFMQDGEIQFHKTIDEVKSASGENKMSKAIITILKNRNNE